jgi:hypothetical protein
VLRDVALHLRDPAVAPTFAIFRGVGLNRMRAFKSRCAGLLPLRIIASSDRRSSALNRTTRRAVYVNLEMLS